MENIKILLGQRIKELRKAKKYTQEQFAEMIDIDQRSLSAIECGINFPTKHFMKIAKTFNVELKDLFDFDHLDVSDSDMRIQSKNFIDKLSQHDLNIIYKLLKAMSI